MSSFFTTYSLLPSYHPLYHFYYPSYLPLLTSHRLFYRLIPWLMDTYQIDEFDRKHITTIIRKNIEQHKDVKDLDTLSVLIFKGEHSFQEAAMLWKTRYPSFYLLSPLIIHTMNIHSHTIPYCTTQTPSSFYFVFYVICYMFF